MIKSTLTLGISNLCDQCISSTIHITNKQNSPIDRINFHCLLLNQNDIKIAEKSWSNIARIEPYNSSNFTMPPIHINDMNLADLYNIRLRIHAKFYVESSEKIETIMIDGGNLTAIVNNHNQTKSIIVNNCLFFDYFPATYKGDKAFFSVKGTFENLNKDLSQYIGICLKVHNWRGAMLTEDCDYMNIPPMATKLLVTTLKFAPDYIRLKMRAHIFINYLKEIDYLTSETLPLNMTT